MTTQPERLARLEEKTTNIETKVDGIDAKLDTLIAGLDKRYASKLTETIVYGMVGLILIAFAGAAIAVLVHPKS